MLNLVDAVRTNPAMRRLAIGAFLFAEFTCGIAQEQAALWSHEDHLVHVLTGKKTWHTADGVFVANPGDSLFFKKGAAIVEQHLEVDFCLLMFFIPDQLIRSTVKEITTGVRQGGGGLTTPSAMRVTHDTSLTAFLDSMRTYFSAKDAPSELLLRLKLSELVLSIVTGGQNPELASYFCSLGDSSAPPLAQVMESNFRFNLSLEEYARLCHRSLSSFKREFQARFNTSPGKWLLQKRLDYSSALLRGSAMNVTEIAFESGFKDVSHFSRVFKERFGSSPAAFRGSMVEM